MPQVSVIIPNYNHGKYLARRIDTVIGQSIDDLQIIILDDASTDDSLTIIAPYLADPRITLITNECNSGNPFVQWNKGVELATSDYVWIAESDDYADPHLLEILMASIKANPGVGLAYCQSWLVDEEGRKTQTFDNYDRSVSKGRWKEGFVNKGADEIRNYLVKKNTIPNASAVLFSRKIYQQAGAAPENLQLCGDWLTWVKILTRCDLVFIPEPLNFFRSSHASSQRTLAKKEALDVLEGLFVLNYVESEINLSKTEFRQSFYAHVSTWAMYAIAYRYSLRLNMSIFRKFSKISREPLPVFFLRSGLLFVHQLGLAFTRLFRK